MFRSGLSEAYLDVDDELDKTPPNPRCEWLSRNWLLLLLILLGMAGILISLLNFFVPCEIVSLLVPQEVTVEYNETVVSNETIVENVTRIERDVKNVTLQILAPARVVVGLDGSGSVKLPGFKKEISSTSTFMGVFGNVFTVDQTTNPIGDDSFFEFGVFQWTNVAPSTILPMQKFDGSTTPSVIQDLQGPNSNVIYKGKGTSFTEAQIGCFYEFQAAKEADDAKGGYKNLPPLQQICMIVSDGFNNDPKTSSFNNLAESKFCLGAKNTSKYVGSELDVDLGKECNDGAQYILEFCDKYLGGTGCTKTNVNKYIKSASITIAGIYIGSKTDAKRQMFETSSCFEDPNYATFEACPLLANAANTDDLQARAEGLANTLVSSISYNETTITLVNETRITVEEESTLVQNITTTRFNVTETLVPEDVCTDTGFWFFFLTMFIPLALYLFWRPVSLFLAKYCCTRPAKAPASAPTRPTTLQEQPLVPSLALPLVPARAPPVIPPRATKPSLPPPAAPEPNALVKSKRYKWSIKAADAYLWNLGASGVAPLNVNFNGAAPPSAPKQEAKEENMKRRTQRISLRWSYQPERASVGQAAPHMAARVSRRVFAQSNPWVPPAREEPFGPDEIGPGDIDYEYSMCLMQCCPCLRPREPEAPKLGAHNPSFGGPEGGHAGGHGTNKASNPNWQDPWAGGVGGDEYADHKGTANLDTMYEDDELPYLEV